eukprot:gnl/MRDRNA2_/MRDRNA2_34359_c0_seq1.p1 gnl/MRDRNA2_/MRDRNA2_34359_c0~~gnl/MRDRNA2_/MRDRNA2_34359_c0_seq1.p1  ORF type:complete len:339 (-),score=64.16 gnl/MRDRNA2_/MRDRNA2_34359_c0_seq1:8-1024(-)
MDMVEAKSGTPENAEARGDVTLKLRTMGGVEYCFEGLHETTTLEEVRLELCQRMRAPTFCVKLIAGAVPVDRFSLTLREAGLVDPDAELVVVRIPGDNSDHIGLFQDLLKAFYSNQHERVQCLIDTGAGFDADGNLLRQDFSRHSQNHAGTSEGSTLLHLAVRHKLTDLALYVIALGWDVNVPNELGRTPLMQAVIKQNEALVDKLLEAKADTHTLDHDGKSAFSYAMEKRNDDLACKLIHPSYMARDLLKACAFDLPKTALALIEGGAGVDCRDEQGRTPLHYAHSHQLTQVTHSLLAKGADPKAQDKNGWCATDGNPGDWSKWSQSASTIRGCSVM